MLGLLIFNRRSRAHGRLVLGHHSGPQRSRHSDRPRRGAMVSRAGCSRDGTAAMMQPATWFRRN